MNIDEKAAFYEELCKRGISIYDSPYGGDESYPVTLKKTFSTADERLYVDEENSELAFPNRDDAITFAVDFIEWKFDQVDELEVEAEAEIHPFDITMVVDLGFGPQTQELGQISSDCNDPDWHKNLQENAEAKATQYLTDNHSDKDIKKIRRQVQFRPSMSGLEAGD